MSGTSLDNAATINDLCIKYNLLPPKGSRNTQAISDKCSRFNKRLTKNKQCNSQILIDLIVKLIEDKSTLNDNIESNYSQEFKEIMNTREYKDTSVEDICVLLGNKAASNEIRRAEACLDKYNEITKLQEEFNNQLENKDNEINKLNKQLRDLKNIAKSQNDIYRPIVKNHYVAKIVDYDPVLDPIEIETVSDEEIDTAAKQQENDLQEQQEQKSAQQEAKEAKDYIESLEAQHEAKRVAARAKFAEIDRLEKEKCKQRQRKGSKKSK